MSGLGSARLAATAFIAGVVLMLVFDAALTRIAGVVLIFAGMATGVFAIATDEFVTGDRDPDSG